MAQPPVHHTSELLFMVLGRMNEGPTPDLQTILGDLKERVFGLAILLFCIPNCLPIPNVAGLSALTGIPIGLIGLEMMMGRSHLWLPAVVGKGPVFGKTLVKVITRVIPYIQKIEELLHPRLLLLTGANMQRFLGLAFVILATIMSLPIPFGNFLPGLAMALMAMALIERDGLVMILGLTVGTGTVLVVLSLADRLLAFVQVV